MTGRGRELADMMERRNVDILCLQETKKEAKKRNKEKKEAKKAWDKLRDKNTKNICKEKKSKSKKAVAMAKGRAYDNLYVKLKTKEGEKELHILDRQRDKAGKDVQHLRGL